MIEQPVARAEAVGPLPSHPAGDGPVVCSCGHVNPAGSDQCGRASCRRTLRGNGLARRTSLYAANSTPEMAEFEAAGCALAEQSITDAGGRTELVARVLADHQYRGLLHVRILKLAHALEAHGEFDRRGRLRKGWIELLDRLINTAVSMDKILGLSRRAKPTPASFADALAQAPEVGDGE